MIAPERGVTYYLNIINETILSDPANVIDSVKMAPKRGPGCHVTHDGNHVSTKNV